MKKDMEKLLNGPILLEPDNFTDHMWGGDWIPRLKGLAPKPGATVGESWEFSTRSERPTQVRLPSGERVSLRELINSAPAQVLGDKIAHLFGFEAPLLVKFIDAKDDLSLQVHPSDDFARKHEQDSGKSEAWVVLEAGTAAGEGCIYLGFNPNKASDYADTEEFAEAFFNALAQANSQGPSTEASVRAKSERLILPFLNKVPVRPGDAFAIEPGTVHALGKGVRLFEIQQASDLTYRVWDWNRPDAKKLKEGKLEFRPLHLQQARRVLNFRAVSPDAYRVPSPVIRDSEKKFSLERFTLNEAGSSIRTSGAFCVLTSVRGAVQAGETRIDQGCSALVPACVEKLDVKAVRGTAELFKSSVPA